MIYHFEFSERGQCANCGHDHVARTAFEKSLGFISRR